MTTLATIDPETVAREIERAVIDHIHSITMRLAPTIVLPALDGAMGLRPTAHALALYAQRGLPAWDWTDHGMAADGLLDVLAALYGRAADGDLSHTEIDIVDDVDPDDAVGTVLVAAAARVRLDRRESLTARELGVLAGVTSVRIRQLMSAGELGATDERPARVKAREARRWLAARGVPGIEPR